MPESSLLGGDIECAAELAVLDRLTFAGTYRASGGGRVHSMRLANPSPHIVESRG
jgi:hypothetical protein